MSAVLEQSIHPKNIFFIPVLNAGYVRMESGWHMGDDLLPVEAARMSTGNPTGVDEGKDDSTRSFLYRKSHSTPFEMSVGQVEIQLPIFVAREIMRHRTFSFNEFSGRYAVMPNLFYVPDENRTKSAGQSATNKQASGNEVADDAAFKFIEKVQVEQGLLRASYEESLDELAIARELARINLPLSQYTRFRMQGVLRNWFHFLDLRLRPNVQYECRLYAEAIAQIIKTLWPKCYELFEEYTLYAAHLSRSDRELMAHILNELVADNLGRPNEDVRTTESYLRMILKDREIPEKRIQEFFFKVLTTGMTDEAR